MIEIRVVEHELGVKPEIQYRFVLFSIGQGGYLCPPNEDMKWSEWRTAPYVKYEETLEELAQGHSTGAL
jgi:hypothetical protein